MKRFIFGSALFIIPIIGCFIFFESKCRDCLAFVKKRNYIISSLANIQIIATGTSHIEFGIYSENEHQIYNWGAAGQSFGYENALFDRYINQMKRLKVVFIEVSETRLLMNDEVSQWNSNVYWIHYGLPYNVNVLNPRSYFHLTQAYDFFRPIVINDLTKKNDRVEVNEAGYMVENHDGRFELLSFNKNEIEKTFKMVYDFDEDSLVIAANLLHLERTINLLKSKGIRVILLHPPFYYTFNRSIPQELVRRLQNKVQDIARFKKVEFWDYTWFMEDSVQYFYNDNHLNKDGARKWTSVLCDSLVNLSIH